MDARRDQLIPSVADMYLAGIGSGKDIALSLQVVLYRETSLVIERLSLVSQIQS